MPDNKHRVTLIFHLNEEVTPQLFAQKVARACATHGALRPDEGVSVPHTKGVYVVSGKAPLVYPFGSKGDGMSKTLKPTKRPTTQPVSKRR